MIVVHKASRMSELWIADILEKRNNPDKSKLFFTGITELDKLIGGIGTGWYCVWGGEQKVGKTTFLLSLAEAHSMQNQLCIYFSREMTTMQLGDQVFAKASKIDKTKFRKPDLTDKEIELLIKTGDKIAQRSVYYVYGFSTVDQIIEVVDKVEELENTYVDAIVVDYLQLMQGNKKANNRTREVEEISRELKTMSISRSNPITIHAGAQINRDSIRSGMLDANAFRDTGSIEQDADIASIIYNKIDDITGIAQLNARNIKIVASRWCPIGKTSYYFDGATANIGNLLEPNQLEMKGM